MTVSFSVNEIFKIFRLDYECRNTGSDASVYDGLETLLCSNRNGPLCTEQGSVSSLDSGHVHLHSVQTALMIPDEYSHACSDL